MPDRDTAILLLAVGGVFALFAPLNRWLVRRARREFRSVGFGDSAGQEPPSPVPTRSGEASDEEGEPEATVDMGIDASWQPEPARVDEARSALADRTTESLKDALRDPDPFVRVAAIAGLAGRTGIEDIVLGALRDEFPQVRREAVRALRDIGGARAGHALSEVVQDDPSAEVREEAVIALAALIERRATVERLPGSA